MMNPSKIDKEAEEKTISFMTDELTKHPLFMYLCPDLKRRPEFIRRYFAYHLPRWIKHGEVLISQSGETVVALLDRNNFEFRFVGRHALKLRLDKNNTRVLMHRHTVRDISNIMIPEYMDVRVMTLFGNLNKNPHEIIDLVNEAKKKAKEENFVLIYETLSKRMIPCMEELDFQRGYQRKFLNTQYIQTMMVYQ